MSVVPPGLSPSTNVLASSISIPPSLPSRTRSWVAITSSVSPCSSANFYPSASPTSTTSPQLPLLISSPPALPVLCMAACLVILQSRTVCTAPSIPASSAAQSWRFPQATLASSLYALITILAMRPWRISPISTGRVPRHLSSAKTKT
eukprot:11145694-Ditylum_brightwellii.AAC.1